MTLRVTAPAAAAALLGTPALAHFGPHDEPPAALFAHLLSHPFHAAPVALVVFLLVGLGVRRLMRAARGEEVE